jgi:integrase
MQKIRLTESNVRTLQLHANKVEDLVADTEVPGLRVRLRRRGDGETHRSFWFYFSRRSRPGQKVKNKSPKLRISDVGGIALADARQVAREHNGALARNQDPVLERATARIKQAETFGAILPRYLNFQRSRLRARSFVEVQRYLSKLAQPLHELPIEKVTRRDIAVLKAEVAESSGRVSSNRLRTNLRGFLHWCVQEGLLESNPALNTTVEKEERRTRVLAPRELVLIWNHLGEEGDYPAIIRLLMILGARASEIGGLRWSEIHGDVIELPPARVKTDKAHLIPLPPLACDILEQLPHRKNRDGSPRDLLFGTGTAVAGFNGWHMAKQRLDQRIAESAGQALAPWVVHDVRRSFSTHLNELSIAPPHIVEALLGHVSGYRAGVAGTYNHAVYRHEKRQALDRWADTLTAWIAGKPGSNVVTLQQRPA